MLVYDPSARMSAKEAASHRYFDTIVHARLVALPPLAGLDVSADVPVVSATNPGRASVVQQPAVVVDLSNFL
jgi:hypothetical protein